MSIAYGQTSLIFSCNWVSISIKCAIVTWQL